MNSAIFWPLDIGFVGILAWSEGFLSAGPIVFVPFEIKFKSCPYYY